MPSLVHSQHAVHALDCTAGTNRPLQDRCHPPIRLLPVRVQLSAILGLNRCGGQPTTSPWSIRGNRRRLPPPSTTACSRASKPCNASFHVEPLRSTACSPNAHAVLCGSTPTKTGLPWKKISSKQPVTTRRRHIWSRRFSTRPAASAHAFTHRAIFARLGHFFQPRSAIVPVPVCSSIPLPWRWRQNVVVLFRETPLPPPAASPALLFDRPAAVVVCPS